MVDGGMEECWMDSEERKNHGCGVDCDWKELADE